MKTVTLTFAGNTVTLTSNEDEMFNLKDLQDFFNDDISKRAGSWLRTKQATSLIEEFLNAQICAVKKKAGRYGGTWAIDEVVYAYAEWLSPEFHRAVIDAFTLAVQGNGDGAVEVAQSVARIEGKNTRKGFASALARHGAQRGDYANMTDVINIAVIGSSSSNKKKELGIKKSAALRDYLSDEILSELNCAEAIAQVMLNRSKDKSHGTMREVVYAAVDKFKEL